MKNTVISTVTNIASLLFLILLSNTSVLAEKPSFSKGVAKQIKPSLNNCGGRSRISAVGEIQSEDGKIWTVPAKTHFETAFKAHDLYNDCGGTELSSLSELKLTDVPVIDAKGNETFTAYIFGDNYFELYINGQLIAVDPVTFTPFNSNVIKFKASRPLTVAVKMVDWEETLGLGMESSRGTQFHAGDGGLVAQFQNDSGKTIAITDSNWKAQTFYTAPIVDRSCLILDGNIRNSFACDKQTVTSTKITSAAHWKIPNNWMMPNFDDNSWPSAVTFTNDTVGVNNKKSYTNFTDIFDAKGADAQFIWSSNLVLDNVVLLRTTIQ